MISSQLASTLLLTFITLVLYQVASKCQQKWQLIWLNPMMTTILLIIPGLVFLPLPYQKYKDATQILTLLLEPAIVALGYPLYMQLRHIKSQWRQIIALLLLGVIIVLGLSFLLTMLIISQQEIAVALSLKSVTTPIGIALTEQFQGDSSITAFAIVIAGLLGGLLGPKWLNTIGVNSAKAQGLAIGAASHVIGTAIIAKTSAQHAAYGSIALIFSALLTALISPALIPYLIQLVS